MNNVSVALALAGAEKRIWRVGRRPDRDHKS